MDYEQDLSIRCGNDGFVFSGFDATMIKPPARFYNAVIPAPIRKGIHNAFNNVQMLPSIANDILQGQFTYAIKDTWRFIGNTTLGFGGFYDFADARMGLPPHSNDLGLTFAAWGFKKSPYVMVPFLGPTTIRDGIGTFGDYTLFTPYPYIRSDYLLNGLLAWRYLDLRAQLFETERLMNEALDEYSFVRDAYLQNRNYLITGDQGDTDDAGSLYVDDEGDVAPAPAPQFPQLPGQAQHATPSTVPARNPA